MRRAVDHAVVVAALVLLKQSTQQRFRVLAVTQLGLQPSQLRLGRYEVEVRFDLPGNAGEFQRFTVHPSQ